MRAEPGKTIQRPAIKAAVELHPKNSEMAILGSDYAASKHILHSCAAKITRTEAKPRPIYCSGRESTMKPLLGCC